MPHNSKNRLFSYVEKGSVPKVYGRLIDRPFSFLSQLFKWDKSRFFKHGWRQQRLNDVCAVGLKAEDI